MIHPGLAALKHWDREEYATGDHARFLDVPDAETAHDCRHCGWKDAITQALESDCHNLALAEGGKDHFQDTWGNLFDSGEEARANGNPFEEERMWTWKEGWITVDIHLGLLVEREQG